MKKNVNINIVPNFQEDDYQIIKNLLDNNLNLKSNYFDSKNEVKKILNFYFPNKEVYFFNSARAGLTFILSLINKNNNKNFVITQAFSCLVVPNSIKFAGFKPIYVDIDKTFNIDIDDLKRKFKKETLAIIIQNTFGIPANLNKIIEFSKENKLLIIENLTHSLGSKYNQQYIGNFGDIALLSFNRNKVISSIIGGALIINNQNLNEKIKIEYEKLPELEEKEIKKILITGKILYEAKKNYNLITKGYLKFLKLKGDLLEMISPIEKKSQKPKNYLTKFPAILFPLLENQIKKLEKFNNQRKEIAQIYLDKLKYEDILNENSEPIFLRFPFLSEKRDYLLKKFKRENIYLGDWYTCVLSPCVDLKNFDYNEGSCSKAEEVSKKILNLPTLIDKEEAEYIISLL